MSSVLILLGLVLTFGVLAVMYVGTTVMAVRMVWNDLRHRYWTDAALDFLIFVLLFSLLLIVAGVLIK